jgi:hypothetical protein
MTESSEEIGRMLVDELEKIVNQKAQYALTVYGHLRDSYQSPFCDSGTPQLESLRLEAALCLLFGMNQAAITITNHLMESFLKYVLAYHFSHLDPSPSIDASPSAQMERLQSAMERVDQMDLEVTIKMACRRNIVGKEDKDILLGIKDEFRNPYSHASKTKLFGQKKTTVYPACITPEGRITPSLPLEINIGRSPLVSWYAQYEHAKTRALPYFIYMDDLIRRTLATLYEGSEVPTARKEEEK